MKISLVGYTTQPFDEGVRKVTGCIAKELDNKGMELEQFNVGSITSLLNIRKFKPDIIHFVLTPTLQGLFIAKWIAFLNPGVKTVLSALHPCLPDSNLLRLFHPDLVLVQSRGSEKLFKSYGFNTEFLPNGVDLQKFLPVNQQQKAELRKMFRLSPEAFIVLHLASMTQLRNLEVFVEIQQLDGCQVLIIGREHENPDEHIMKKLLEAGCIVWNEHFDSIWDIYNLSDCYVFPTVEPRACIETPLSVLEAMACNLPIITTRYQALMELFCEGKGFNFIDSQKEIGSLVESLKSNAVNVDTRSQVLNLSWENIGKNLVEMYGVL
jgi:glycosyltransferase involved in cell wall biosynthesis